MSMPYTKLGSSKKQRIQLSSLTTFTPKKLTHYWKKKKNRTEESLPDKHVRIDITTMLLFSNHLLMDINDSPNS